jgi:iduronate 2-sulfatase
MKYSPGLYILFLLSLAAFSSCGGDQTPQSPNVVFIVVDDLNTTLGCYGHPLVRTPNVDRLAEQGILFRNAYCNYSVCNPSRSSFLTGLRPETINILGNRTHLESVLDGRITMPGLFRSNGYYTVSIGKVFHGSNEHNDPDAWDEIYHYKTTDTGRRGEGRNLTGGKLRWCRWLAAEGGDEDQEDGQATKKAIEFLKGEHEQPFFLAIGLAKPHDPFIAPKKYFDLYNIEECVPPEIPYTWEPPYPHTLPGGGEKFKKFTDRERMEFLRAYFACTSFMDAQLGKILDAMDEEGLMDHTLIFFFGDHGYHLGEHGWWNKVTVYQKGHHAPLIVRTGDPEEAGKKTGAMVEFVDFYPTLANYCNLEGIPEYLEGKDFGVVLKDPGRSFRDHVNIIIKRGDFLGRSVKTREWRYTEWDDGNRGIELYDQLNDPLEYNNLSGEACYDSLKAVLKSLIIRPRNNDNSPES